MRFLIGCIRWAFWTCWYLPVITPHEMGKALRMHRRLRKPWGGK